MYWNFFTSMCACVCLCHNERRNTCLVCCVLCINSSHIHKHLSLSRTHTYRSKGLSRCKFATTHSPPQWQRERGQAHHPQLAKDPKGLALFSPYSHKMRSCLLLSSLLSLSRPLCLTQCTDREIWSGFCVGFCVCFFIITETKRHVPAFTCKRKEEKKERKRLIPLEME